MDCIQVKINLLSHRAKTQDLRSEIVAGFTDWSEYAIISAANAKSTSNACESKPIKQGEPIFIYAAPGAVGQVVGQYCRQSRLRRVGSTGSRNKVKYLLKELNFDVAIDICFENIGGKISEALLEVTNNRQSDRVDNLTQIIGKRICMEGFMMNDRLDLFPKTFETFAKYLIKDKMKYKEHITEKIRNLPVAFIDIFEIRSFSKTLIKIGSL
ncbi:hypothetical protein K502DRAFT_364166 [Neoconidiobolus thromboides FSU 785]|nr:hypothetical protein K502DRAFT_364166 [Neoconidiobolus thromboides FSU 785]